MTRLKLKKGGMKMRERDYIVTIYRSAGTDFIGEMWTETRIFKHNKSLKEVMDWVDEKTNNSAYRTRVVITVAEGEY